MSLKGEWYQPDVGLIGMMGLAQRCTDVLNCARYLSANISISYLVHDYNAELEMSVHQQPKEML